MARSVAKNRMIILHLFSSLQPQLAFSGMSFVAPFSGERPHTVHMIGSCSQHLPEVRMGKRKRVWAQQSRSLWVDAPTKAAYLTTPYVGTVLCTPHVCRHHVSMSVSRHRLLFDPSFRGQFPTEGRRVSELWPATTILQMLRYLLPAACPMRKFLIRMWGRNRGPTMAHTQ